MNLYIATTCIQMYLLVSENCSLFCKSNWNNFVGESCEKMFSRLESPESVIIPNIYLQSKGSLITVITYYLIVIVDIVKKLWTLWRAVSRRWRFSQSCSLVSYVVCGHLPVKMTKPSRSISTSRNVRGRKK